MADQQAIQDDNRVPALIAHTGTAGTSETRRVVADTSGAMMVNIGGTEPFELTAGTVDEVTNIAGGTITLSNPTGTVVEVNDGTLSDVTMTSGTITGVNNVISTDNSTTGTLAADATYTGTGENITNYAAVRVNVYSDQNSATDGFQAQYSSDGTNWDVSYDFTVTGGRGEVYEFGPEAEYFRVVYTNGGTTQSEFRLQTILHPQVTQHTGVPIKTAIEGEDNAQLMKAVLAGENPQGTYVDIQTTTAGNLKVGVEEFEGNVTLPRVGNLGTIESGSVIVTSIPQVSIGTIPQISVGTLPTVSLDDYGTVVDINTIPQVSVGTIPNVNVASGTQQTLGTVGTVEGAGTISNLGSITNIAYIHEIGTMPASGGGTQFDEDSGHTTGDGGNMMLGVRVDNGTSLVDTDLDYGPFQLDANGALRISGTVATGGAGTQPVSFTDDPLGSVIVTASTVSAINADLPGGTVDLITSITDLGSVNNVGVVHNAGTVAALPDLPGGTVDLVSQANVTVGTFSADIPGGTVDEVTSLSGGTIQLDQNPTQLGTPYHVRGTAAGAGWGTIITAAGAGTNTYVSHVDVVVASGTVDVALSGAGVDGSTGANVLARGQFVPGGGITKEINPTFQSGTNGTIAYWLGGAGTVDMWVNYWSKAA